MTRLSDEFEKWWKASGWEPHAAKPIARETWLAAIAADRAARAEPVRQYYYKSDACKAKSARDSDCICWRDEGTGPMANSERELTWRDKPATPVVPERVPDAFREWVVRELPPTTVIGDPEWWALRMWAAARLAMLAAPAPSLCRDACKDGGCEYTQGFVDKCAGGDV